mmetsp:Transcript_18210/g.15877  ORF Transcript_18210/g.15877 Transcript_18210/m.15877 type:complete len:87 (-) Transcript_18210:526-786(-)
MPEKLSTKEPSITLSFAKLESLVALSFPRKPRCSCFAKPSLLSHSHSNQFQLSLIFFSFLTLCLGADEFSLKQNNVSDCAAALAIE